MNDQRHMKIIEDSSKFIADLDTLYYKDSNEKLILRNKLSSLLAGCEFNEAIDLGAGPGLVSAVLQQHAKNLTLLEITPDYYDSLKKLYPNATVKIQSVLDFVFKQQYDLMLFSHVLYYIAADEWEILLKKLYGNLTAGGKLIVVHSPCHHIHNIFNSVIKIDQLAYMNEYCISQLMDNVGPHTKDYYLSTSYYHDHRDYPFAIKFLNSFFGKSDPALFKNYSAQLDQLLDLFIELDGKLGLDYHNDIYIFSK